MELQSIGSGYEGSLSPLTRYGTLNISATRVPRKRRSKGNKVDPRTSGPSSECVSYRIVDGVKVEGRIFKPARKQREGSARKVESEAQRIMAEQQAARLAKLAAIGNNSDAD